MPLDGTFPLSRNARWARWRIDEPLEALQAQYPLVREPEREEWSRLSAPRRRLEWLAGRALLSELVQGMGLPYAGVVKDAHGCPLLSEAVAHVSLSHSGGRYAVAQIDRSGPTGVDLERVTDKPLRVARKFLSEEEREWAVSSPALATRAWCVKEALYKRFGRHQLSFRQDMRIAPFAEDDDTARASVRTAEGSRTIRLFLESFDGVALAGCLD